MFSREAPYPVSQEFANPEHLNDRELAIFYDSLQESISKTLIKIINLASIIRAPLEYTDADLRDAESERTEQQRTLTSLYKNLTLFEEQMRKRGMMSKRKPELNFDEKI